MGLVFPFLCHDNDGFYWPGRIWHTKDILEKVWKKEIRRKGLGDTDKTVVISTLTYRVKITKYLTSSGSRHFLFDLSKVDEAGMLQGVFVNNSYAHKDHLFARADRALICAKAFLKEYEMTGNLVAASPVSPIAIMKYGKKRSRAKPDKKGVIPDGVAPEDAFMYEE